VGKKEGILLLQESLQLLEHYGFSVLPYALVRQRLKLCSSE